MEPSSYGLLPRIFQSLIYINIDSIDSPSLLNSRNPFLKYPCLFRVPSYTLIQMFFCYRFNPSISSSYILKIFHLPLSFDRLRLKRDQLGLLFHRRPLDSKKMSLNSYMGIGLRGLIHSSLLDKPKAKCIVDVMTYCHGIFGRIVVLACAGIGLTVWYGYSPPYGTLSIDSIRNFYSYEAFLNLDSFVPGFHRIGFIESSNISAPVISAYNNDYPFTEMDIDGINLNHEIYVGLGLLGATVIV